MNVSDGMNYAPKGKPSPVVKPGEFIFSAVRLDHLSDSLDTTDPYI